MKIVSVEIMDVECDVYDIEVEDDHCYVVEGVVLHNCTTCAAAEAGSPYEIGKQPQISLHPRCRCINVPYIPDVSRPTVRDSRPVSQIPLDERTPGKIGQTRRTMEQFIDSMTYAERREWMGPARAELWRDGKITNIKQLVDDVTLEPLRLDQLPS